MASPETVAVSKCEGAGCGKDVAVKINRGNLAYYRCDHCGRGVTHHWQKSSDAFLRSLGAGQPAPEPAAPVNAPAPAKPGKTPEKPAQQAPAPARERSTFFS